MLCICMDISTEHCIQILLLIKKWRSQILNQFHMQKIQGTMRCSWRWKTFYKSPLSNRAHRLKCGQRRNSYHNGNKILISYLRLSSYIWCIYDAVPSMDKTGQVYNLFLHSTPDTQRHKNLKSRPYCAAVSLDDALWWLHSIPYLFSTHEETIYSSSPARVVTTVTWLIGTCRFFGIYHGSWLAFCASILFCA